MLAFDSVKLHVSNASKELSFLQLSYMILQACDYVELSNKRHGCVLQMGGSDPVEPNIISSIDLDKAHTQRAHNYSRPPCPSFSPHQAPR